MGIAVRLPEANFTHFVDREFPHIERAAGYFLFGEDATQSAINRAPNAQTPTGAFIGSTSPVFGPNYVDFQYLAPNDSSLETGVSFSASEQQSFTYICVATNDHSALTAKATCGTQHSSLNGNYLRQSAGPTAGATGAWNGSGSLNATGTSLAGRLQFTALTRSGTGLKDIYFHDEESLKVTSGTGAAVAPANTYRVGPMSAPPQNLSVDGTSRHAANLVFKERLTAAELLDIYGYLKYKLAQRGVGMV